MPADADTISTLKPKVDFVVRGGGAKRKNELAYLAAELLELSGNVARRLGRDTTTPGDVRKAVQYDPDLSNLF